MQVRGRTTRKWQDCEIVRVDGQYRFRVPVADHERQFDLSWNQLIQATDCADFSTCTAEEMRILKYFWDEIDTSLERGKLN